MRLAVFLFLACRWALSPVFSAMMPAEKGCSAGRAARWRQARRLNSAWLRLAGSQGQRARRCLARVPRVKWR
ncbi:hypothetical protein CBW21_20930 [Chromobacterium violaceum]|uniref:Uncharacterized protein n=1 Tax=Chromobacterium violaceum TaxID=536 RepID=A0A202B3B4_CHRVL|nr:hypothetical protein CBW21_20930 [Chromobacterium violaceum]